MTVPDPFPLRNIPVPAEVTAVEGCTCGGLEWHVIPSGGHPGCALYAETAEKAHAAVNAAIERLSWYTVTLNARLWESLRKLEP